MTNVLVVVTRYVNLYITAETLKTGARDKSCKDRQNLKGVPECINKTKPVLRKLTE